MGCRPFCGVRPRHRSPAILQSANGFKTTEIEAVQLSRKHDEFFGLGRAKSVSSSLSLLKYCTSAFRHLYLLSELKRTGCRFTFLQVKWLEGSKIIEVRRVREKSNGTAANSVAQRQQLIGSTRSLSLLPFMKICTDFPAFSRIILLPRPIISNIIAAIS